MKPSALVHDASSGAKALSPAITGKTRIGTHEKLAATSLTPIIKLRQLMTANIIIIIHSSRLRNGTMLCIMISD